MQLSISYAAPSAFTSSRERADLSLAGSRGVRFRGKVIRHGFMLRMALRALGRAIGSQDTGHGTDSLAGVLDPLVTVHPDRLWLEACRGDLGAWCALIVAPEVFEPEGETVPGTTPIDFSAWVWRLLDEMRTSRTTWLNIGSLGVEVTARGRCEQKVDIPDASVRGLLELQAAMALPGTHLTLRPVDLLAAIRFLEVNKARVSPRALRYELHPGQEARLVLEPWEEGVPLSGAVHAHTEPRIIRTWGRRHLTLIEPLLPFAERVDVYLKGRGLPVFYAVKLPGMSFLLGTASDAHARFGGASRGDLPALAPAADCEAVVTSLARAFHLTPAQAAEATGLPLERAAGALTALCRQGRVMVDLEARGFRHRELFTPPVDVSHLYPADPRREELERLIAGGVTDLTVRVEEERRLRRYLDPLTGEKSEREALLRQWRIEGRCGPQHPSILVNAEERILFGQCGCRLFQDHRVSSGPCPHMLALFELSERERNRASA